MARRDDNEMAAIRDAYRSTFFFFFLAVDGRHGGHKTRATMRAAIRPPFNLENDTTSLTADEMQHERHKW